MVGAALMAHLEHGFFINWFNKEGAGHGIEYHILAVGLALALLIRGGGFLSVDRALSGKS
jgi:putative oxidoreductase